MARAALLIGVSTYESGFNPLPSAVRDIQAIKQVLQNPQIGGFNETDIRMLENPDPQRMREEIESLFADRHKDDLLLLYFSGHGVKDDSGSFYLTNFRTRKNRLNSTAISSDEIHRLMEASRSKYQVVILDCCFSGAFATGMTAKADGVNVSEQLNQLGGQGRAVLTSSSAVEYSFEQKERDLSVYTHYLVEGIATGAADIGCDGMIAIDELHKYVSDKVCEAHPAMNPGIYAAREGYNIVLAKAPIGDPKLEYRRVVERLARQREISFASRGVLDDLREQLKQPPKTDVRISVVGRGTLNALRDKLELAPDIVADIEAEVLKPYRKFEENRQLYKQVLTKATRKEKVLSQSTRESLRHFQQVLGLRDEDIADIEAQAAQRTRQKRSDIKPIPTSNGSNRLLLAGVSVPAILAGVFLFSSYFFQRDQGSVVTSPLPYPDFNPVEPTNPTDPSLPAPDPSEDSLPPFSPGIQTSEDELLQKAMNQVKQGDYQEAIRTYDQVIQINSGNANAYLGRGDAFYRFNNFQKAIDDYNQAVEHGHTDVVLYMNRGNAYAAFASQQTNPQLSQTSQDKAFDDYTQAIKLSLDHPNPDAYMGRGNVGRSQNKAIAIDDYEQAQKLYLKKGDTAKYRQALEAVDKLRRGER